MTVDEFIKEYEQKKKKVDYTPANHITLKYMPHAKKIAFVKGIINASSYDEVNGKKIYKRDTPNMMFLFSMRLVKEYTDIEVVDSEVVQNYDALVSSGAMNSILDAIPSEEVKLLKGMLDLARDDLEVNTRSLVSFLETKFESMDLAMESILKVLDKPEIKEKINEFKDSNK